MMENDRTHWAMAILLVSFGIGMTAVARAGERALVRSVRLRFQNARLVDDLSSAREQLTCLNRELEERITARTYELQQAVADREHRVSIVSHELRGPLQSLKLAAGPPSSWSFPCARRPTPTRGKYEGETPDACCLPIGRPGTLRCERAAAGDTRRPERTGSRPSGTSATRGCRLEVEGSRIRGAAWVHASLMAFYDL